MKIKPRTYYKRYYDKDDYDILYTNVKHVYPIAVKYKNALIHKFTKKFKWTTIKKLQKNINDNIYTIRELSKSDVFLELL